jgi:hypothetical protein
MWSASGVAVFPAGSVRLRGILMFNAMSLSLAGLLAAMTLSACASTAAGGLTGSGEPAYVALVEVVQHDKGAPAAFAETLRQAVVRDAVFYGVTGRPIALKIDLDKVHFKNVLKAMIIGDSSLAKGRVAVVDPAGQPLGNFAVQVDAERPGMASGSIAMAVVGAFDPTGLVDVATTVGTAASADINRPGTVAAMAANFSAETLRQTFGDTRTKAVNTAKKQARAPSKGAAAR